MNLYIHTYKVRTSAVDVKTCKEVGKEKFVYEIKFDNPEGLASRFWHVT